VLILIIVGTIFVGRHEAQLSAEAERALPGPLKWPWPAARFRCPPPALRPTSA